MSERALPDDRILPVTRAIVIVVVGILVLATDVLYLHPEQTPERFAWTIQPTFTAMVMGAGYGSSIYFFARVALGRRWHLVSAGFNATIVFVWMMLGATLLHWERFHHGQLAFRLWWWIYLVAAVAVPIVWFWNRRREARRPDAPRMADGVRRILGAAGVVLAAVAAWLYLAPESAIGVWPWELTPLTARAVAAFVALPGVTWLTLALDGRWERGRIAVETVWIGVVMLLVAVGRAWDQFDRDNPITWLYVGGLVATAVGLSVLWVAMRDRPTVRAAAAGVP